MKKHHYLALGRYTEILSLGNCIKGANNMKQMQFNCNKGISIFVQFQTMTITFTRVEYKYENNEKHKIPS